MLEFQFSTLLGPTRCLLLTVALMLPAARLNAADPAPPANPPAKAPTREDTKLIPELNISSGVKLGDVIDLVRDMTGTNIVVANPSAFAGIDAPVMHLKRVTVPQFMELLTKALPEVTAEATDADGNPIWIVRATVQAAQPVMVPGAFGGPGVPPMPDPNRQFVVVFPLRDIVDQQMRLQGKPDAKEALDAVLSLLQAALDQASAGDHATLKVHEATQTLVFKGTQEFQIVLIQTLDALRPSDEEKKQAARATDLNRMQDQQKQKLDDAMERAAVMQQRLASREAQMEQMQAELVRAQVQLDQMSKHPSTKP